MLIFGARKAEALAIGGNSTGSGANAAAVASLPAVPLKKNFLATIMASGGGATAASLQTLTITGCKGGSIVQNIAIPAGVTQGWSYQNWFDPPLEALDVNTAIVATMTACGAGNTASAVSVQGLIL